MGYFVNPLSVLFHPELDTRNRYQTVVYNWRKQSVLKVNQFGYEILKILDEKPGLSLAELCQLVSPKEQIPPQLKSKIEKFSQQMIKENVIEEKN